MWPEKLSRHVGLPERETAPYEAAAAAALGDFQADLDQEPDRRLATKPAVTAHDDRLKNHAPDREGIFRF
jgi:hypothetical protein